MIYKNKELAKEAQVEFCSKQEALEQAYGVTFEVDDCCVGTWWTVQYYDENQKECTLW